MARPKDEISRKDVKEKNDEKEEKNDEKEVKIDEKEVKNDEKEAKSDEKEVENDEKPRKETKDEKIDTIAKRIENSSTVDHPRMADLRAKVLDYIKANGKAFHPDDVELLQRSNLWINRFLNFCDQSFDNAFDHLVETFKYRNESGVRSIDKGIFPIECWLSSTAFIYLPDKEGRPMLYVRVKNHLKADGKFNGLFKQFLCVLIDEIDKLANKEFGYNLFLDLYGMGWKSLDLDMLHFLIDTTRNRYPNGSKYVFVHGLPWFLNLIIKNIVNALPSDTSKKVRFLNGSHYKELSLDQVTSNFVESSDLNNNTKTNNGNTILDDKDDAKRTKLDIEDFIDIHNVPSYLGGKAKLNFRIMPRTAISSIYKVGTSIYNYSESETDRLCKPFKNVINDAQNSYRTFKEQKFNFEFDLDEISAAYAKHIRL